MAFLLHLSTSAGKPDRPGRGDVLRQSALNRASYLATMWPDIKMKEPLTNRTYAYSSGPALEKMNDDQRSLHEIKCQVPDGGRGTVRRGGATAHDRIHLVTLCLPSLDQLPLEQFEG